MPFVAEVGEGEHDDRGGNIRRRDKALGGREAKAHALFQNDGEEVGDGVRVGSGEAEEGGEAPDFEIEGVAEVGTNAEGLRDGVVAVLLDPSDDEGGFLFVEELQAEVLGRLLREVDDQHVACEAKNAGDEALHDEDPAPTSETALFAARGCRVF